MKDHGFLETRTFGSARDILAIRNRKNGLFTVNKYSKVSEAIGVMIKQGMDQIPVTENGKFIGSVSSSGLLEKIMSDPQLQQKQVSGRSNGQAHALRGA